MDPALEVELRNALERLLAGRTSITIAHPLSTAEASDRILVFDRGLLVEDGSHAELLATDGVYAGMSLPPYNGCTKDRIRLARSTKRLDKF